MTAEKTPPCPWQTPRIDIFRRRLRAEMPRGRTARTNRVRQNLLPDDQAGVLRSTQRIIKQPHDRRLWTRSLNEADDVKEHTRNAFLFFFKRKKKKEKNSSSTPGAPLFCVSLPLRFTPYLVRVWLAVRSQPRRRFARRFFRRWRRE